MLSKNSRDGYHSPLAGVSQKTLVYGDKTLMVEFRLDKGAILPRHSHPHEQSGYLVSGRIRLHIEGQSYDCGPGDSWCVAGDAEHGADVLEDAVAIEVFSPVREAYIPKQ